ncbi:hypothetical protein QFC22_003607 [Naganishia vaughanmartiniae]|uniref:Uncharacterized protein n=1 Tax=Naganishia vaughanmartiniae TaxID=1424756 RepID=A0ACC2X6Q6_9TREE|nr:hypothetical protein QFC22_003607 [Naganishia vaughanmartiniae]
MPPKKNVNPDAPVAEPRRSTRVSTQPPKPAVELKAKPASKKAPASKKRAAEEEPTANGDADKAPVAEKPASKKPKSSAEKPTSKPKSASKPASKKAPTSNKKPASSAKPKSGKKAADKANGDAIPEENTEAAAEAEKEAEAAPEDKADTGDVKEMAEGDVFPRSPDNKGQDIDVSTLCDADHGLVIFVYPKANTPGCTTQACNYRDSYEEFTKLGYKVYGLSADTVSAQDKWATTKEFKYNLLADTKHDLLKQLGAFVPPKNIKRSHFIFEKGTGKLIEKKLGVKPAEDTKNALSFIQSRHK